MHGCEAPASPSSNPDYTTGRHPRAASQSRILFRAASPTTPQGVIPELHLRAESYSEQHPGPQHRASSQSYISEQNPIQSTIPDHTTGRHPRAASQSSIPDHTTGSHPRAESHSRIPFRAASRRTTPQGLVPELHLRAETTFRAASRTTPQCVIPELHLRAESHSELHPGLYHKQHHRAASLSCSREVRMTRPFVSSCNTDQPLNLS